VDHLALKVRQVDDVVVDDPERADARRGEVKRGRRAKATGAEVNVDLISGLAGETPETWAYSVRRAIEADVHNITIYKLELYANTPYYTAEKHHEIALPGQAEELEFIQYAVDELKRHDYHAVNTFTFTKGGAYDQLNTRNRWQGADSYACGVSAYGSLGRFQYQNTNDIQGYTAAIARQELPAFRGYYCSSFDLIVRDAVMGIKLVALDHRRFLDKHGLDLLQVCAGDLARLGSDGFITIDEREIRGRPAESEKGMSMTADQVLEELRRIIVEDLDVDVDRQDLTPTVPLFENGLGLDSVVLVELISCIEKRFDVMVPDDMLTVETFKDLQSVAGVIGSLLAAVESPAGRG